MGTQTLLGHPRKMGTLRAKEERPHNAQLLLSKNHQTRVQKDQTRLPPVSTNGASVTLGERLAQCSVKLEA